MTLNGSWSHRPFACLVMKGGCARMMIQMASGVLAFLEMYFRVTGLLKASLIQLAAEHSGSRSGETGRAQTSQNASDCVVSSVSRAPGKTNAEGRNLVKSNCPITPPKRISCRMETGTTSAPCHVQGQLSRKLSKIVSDAYLPAFHVLVVCCRPDPTVRSTTPPTTEPLNF